MAKEVIVLEDSPQACIKDTAETPQKKKRVNVNFTSQKYTPESNPFIEKGGLTWHFVNNLQNISYSFKVLFFKRLIMLMTMSQTVRDCIKMLTIVCMQR